MERRRYFHRPNNAPLNEIVFLNNFSFIRLENELMTWLLSLQDGVGGDHRTADQGAHVRQLDHRRVRVGSAGRSSRVSWPKQADQVEVSIHLHDMSLPAKNVERFFFF